MNDYKQSNENFKYNIVNYFKYNDVKNTISKAEEDSQAIINAMQQSAQANLMDLEDVLYEYLFKIVIAEIREDYKKCLRLRDELFNLRPDYIKDNFPTDLHKFKENMNNMNRVSSAISLYDKFKFDK